MKQMDIKDAYNVIAAELLKLNSHRLLKALPKKHESIEWGKETKSICVREIRENPIADKNKYKASASFLWGWILLQKISIRGTNMMIVKWLLDNEITTFTSAFNSKCSEIAEVLEDGYNNKTDVSEIEEIQEEWFLITENYYPVFKDMINDLLTEDGVLAA